jgi:putative hemolysin
MFQYTGGDKGPYLNLLLVHDDAEREYDYLTRTDEVMTAAAQSPWVFVSMKKDFKTMFPAPAATPALRTGASVANPATQNCLDRGGQHFTDVRGDGVEYGVCVFGEGVCTEQAMLDGACPVGGVKVSGYATPAALYCVITGGEYAVTANSGQNDPKGLREQGTCTLKDGTQCDVWDHYNGKCDASTATPPAETRPAVTITATQVITYTSGPPTGEPREGSCWTSSLAVWREDAWRCTVGNEIYDPCFSSGESVICGANPTTPTVSFILTLTEPLPEPEAPGDTAGHAWLVELADGTVCGYATGATGGVGDDRINYLCPSPDPSQSVVILGDLRPGAVWMAKRAVVTGSMPDLRVLESAEVPIRTVWR